MDSQNDDCIVTHGNPIRHISDDMHPEVPAWLCARMPDHWYRTFRAMYANDYTNLDDLERKLYMFSVKTAVRHKWRTEKADIGEERLRRLCKLAISEMVEPARYQKSESWRLRAAIVGKSKSQWFAVWKGRYEIMFTELNEWSNRAYRFMKVKKVKQLVDKPGLSG